jgi:hypothetical protein
MTIADRQLGELVENQCAKDMTAAPMPGCITVRAPVSVSVTTSERSFWAVVIAL